MPTFRSKRIVKIYTMTVSSPPEKVFPLLCPVREYEWIDYWDCRTVYSESGVAENNCIFTTHFPERGDMVWVVTRYEPPHAIEFTVFSPGSHVWKLDIGLRAGESGTTVAVWTYTMTATTEHGNELIDRYSDEIHRKRMSRLEESLQHYCRTGEMLRRR